ncbi:LD-carboxypeptidase [Methylobacterium sp. WL6]|uniref:LD-carboxypeptidase n=1 Tax=Methylobacterium sp. WL6 TaxID=2603901 RepID=UPI001FEE9B93|nr:LD-carboxypeptidase [Methylobacterium sp. WL6]
MRLITHVDLGVIAAHPKAFLGYSDTTVIGFGCLRAGLVSFYGPTIMSGFAENGGPLPHMVASLRRTLFTTAPVGVVEPSHEGWTVERLDWSDPQNQFRRRPLRPSSGPRVLRGNGIARGHLVGGCADTLETLKGTAWWPPLDYWRDALLFLETSEEAPSPALMTCWLRNYAAQGILQVLNGILFARPGGHRLSVTDHAAYDAAILQALDEAGLTALPVLSNLDFGHTDPIFTLPYGVQAEIDCECAQLRIVESATS